MSATAARRRHAPQNDSLSTYLQEIRAYPLLTREQESALGSRIRMGDTHAVDELVCSNLRFVVSIAKRYQHQGVPLADLINEGNLGLMRAAEKFDDQRGVKFISYAVWWVRQAIAQAVAEHGHAVRVPVGRAGMLYRISRRANVLRHELGREPTQEELLEGLGVSEADIASTAPIARSYLSLNSSTGEGDDMSLLDYIADDSSAAPDHEATNDDLAKSVEEALSLLKGREARVVRLHFGLDGGEPMTLESIGRMLGVTRERVRQIKEKALSRLRRSNRGVVLASLCER